MNIGEIEAEQKEESTEWVNIEEIEAEQKEESIETGIDIWSLVDDLEPEKKIDTSKNKEENLLANDIKEQQEKTKTKISVKKKTKKSSKIWKIVLITFVFLFMLIWWAVLVYVNNPNIIDKMLWKNSNEVVKNDKTQIEQKEAEQETHSVAESTSDNNMKDKQENNETNNIANKDGGSNQNIEKQDNEIEDLKIQVANLKKEVFKYYKIARKKWNNKVKTRLVIISRWLKQLLSSNNKEEIKKKLAEYSKKFEIYKKILLSK